MIETSTDLRSLVDEYDFGIRIDLGSGVEVVGVFNRDFDQSLEVNGRRTTFRLVASDADLIAVGSTISIKHDPANDAEDFIVRAKEKGERLTLLILETG